PLAGANVPVLYDMTNGLRYAAVVNPDNSLSFALGGSSGTTQFVLVNEDPSTVQQINGLTVKNFANYNVVFNQGNYIIIANSLLYTGTSGNNPVADYKTYRSSAAGGGFNVIIADISDLIDQFAFGVRENPLSIQNFLRYARSAWAAPPKFVLLMGHSMTYDQFNLYSEVNHDPLAAQLDMVPTWGYPASDNMLAAANGAGTIPVTPIGRLSVVSGAEIEAYTAKVKEYEQAQQISPNTIAGRLWMKDAVHLTGVSEPYLGTIICNYVTSYAQIISDTLCGANVSIYCDGNASQVTQVPAGSISNLFSTGFSVLNYFGHSSNDVLAYNLNNPTDYSNTGKYPVMFVNGCDAGDFFIYDAQRFSTSKTLSETWVLSPEHGAIAFVASTNFGIVNYLNILLNNLYVDMTSKDYGKPLGVLQSDAEQGLINAAPGDFFARLHAEQMTIHGDPALKLNQGPTDYDIEASQVQINPAFISISNGTFDVKARFFNLGKAVPDSVVVQVTRTYPSGATAVLLNKKIPGIRYSDSIDISVPIVGTRDKGQNSITVSIDPGQTIPEVTYLNNTVTTQVYIYQNEATPIYPYNYAIITTPTTKLVASTANPLATSQQYIMELDTTQNFNSPLMVTKNITSSGGELEFDPQVTYRDSTVYYWRVGIVPSTPGGNYTWNYSSFIYIDPAHSSSGFNQSHYFQHLGSTGNQISMAANRQWAFNTQLHNIYQRNAVYPDGGTYDVDFSVSVDGAQNIQSACLGGSLIFNVFNPITFTPWINVDSNGNNLYRYGSGSANCAPTRYYNFEFYEIDAPDREKIRQFMDSIPNGYWVTVKNIPSDNPAVNVYSRAWLADTAIYGSGNSIYYSLYNAGLTLIDSFDQPRAFLFIYKKNDPSFAPQQAWGNLVTDAITLSSTCPGPYFTGTVTSPEFGPAKQWNTVHWRGSDGTVPATDTVGVQVIGIDTLGNFTPLYNMPRAVQDLDVSAINAKQYPYLQLKMTTLDTVHAVPYQLSYWRTNYVPVPEGALAPNLVLKSQDTVQLGQNMEFEIAFKNVSPYAFDSMKIQFYILDRNNVMHNIVMPRRRPLVSGDTLIFDYILNTTTYPGANTLYLMFNPANDQPEQFLFNNFLYKTFYVKGDTRSPTMDVTFDNVHILNNDIVSAKPHILIRLQSQSQYLLLKDTSLFTVQVQYPDGSLHNYYFNGDTVRFTPATSTNNNAATVNFTPAFSTQFNPQGDVYQLIVTAKDELGNMVGTGPYRIAFTIINKPMISNVFNYPNPFSTSTAFVFTVTGSQVPQNIKIQILTITGKVVREITKEELGSLHVGTNITEFKWNGTDMYGNRLANGVYLYHVVTNLNGQSLSKYNQGGTNTDRFFNNGYGKMYLMR
ncbi:MAG TPA: C25 family cysteine peptidase, partial [Puia sp.]|nr:C25 family cysteine peptidase [Puia sp.]